MKFFKVRTDYDCLVKNKDGENLLDANSELLFESPEKLLIYPLSHVNKNCYPFVLDLSGEEKSRFYKKFELKGYDLFYISNLPFVNNEIIEKVTINQKEFKVILNEGYLKIETDKMAKTLPLNNLFDDFEIQTIENFVLIHLISEKECLCIFNAENDNINFFEGNKIEIFEKRISITRELNDIARHIIFESYEIKNSIIEKVDSGLKHSFEFENIIKNPNLVPLAFLEAIKYEDFELAKFYLNDKLSSTPNNQFKEYFKTFSKIIPLEKLTYGLVSGDKLKVFHFQMENNKIAEISEGE